MSNIAPSTQPRTPSPVVPLQLKGEMDEIGETVHRTTTMAEEVMGDWETVLQGLVDLQAVVKHFTQPLEQDESIVQLPPGAAASIKDLSERQARIAASAVDVLGNLDIKFPDLVATTKALEARVEGVKKRAKAIDQRYKELVMPFEAIEPREDLCDG